MERGTEGGGEGRRDDGRHLLPNERLVRIPCYGATCSECHFGSPATSCLERRIDPPLSTRLLGRKTGRKGEGNGT